MLAKFIFSPIYSIEIIKLNLRSVRGEGEGGVGCIVSNFPSAVLLDLRSRRIMRSCKFMQQKRHDGSMRTPQSLIKPRVLIKVGGDPHSYRLQQQRRKRKRKTRETLMFQSTELF